MGSDGPESAVVSIAAERLGLKASASKDTPSGSIGTPNGVYPIADVSVYNDSEVSGAGGKLSGLAKTNPYFATIFASVL